MTPTAPILQKRLTFAPWAEDRTRRLPGVVPIAMDQWLEVDDAYAAQMAERARLIEGLPERVLALNEAARPAAEELYDTILPLLAPLGFRIAGDSATRPDGVSVALDRADPLRTLGLLVQQDLCLMQAGPEGHVLTGAVLCFPAGWTLTEKMGRAMFGIHIPVAKYTEDLGTRVQRLMDGVQPGRPLMRGTAHHFGGPLHNPRSEAQGREPVGALPWIRVERQVLLRLPQTRAVTFSIHTQIVDPADLTPEQAATLEEFPIRDAA